MHPTIAHKHGRTPQQRCPIKPTSQNPPRLVTPETRTEGDYLTSHADAQTEVGQSLEKLGAAGQEVGNKAMQFAGMANDTAATQADVAFAGKAGSIYSKFASLTGSEAVAAGPSTKAAIQQAYQETLHGMSPGAAKSAGMMMARTAISREFDIDTHVATQQKEANRMAGLSLVNAAANIDGPTAMDDGRFGAAVGDIKHGVGMQMQGPMSRIFAPILKPAQPASMTARRKEPTPRHPIRRMSIRRWGKHG